MAVPPWRLIKVSLPPLAIWIVCKGRRGGQKCLRTHLRALNYLYGRVAQLVEQRKSKSFGRGFEPRRALRFPKPMTPVAPETSEAEAIEWCNACLATEHRVQVVPGEKGYPLCALHGTAWGRVVQYLPYWLCLLISQARHWPRRAVCLIRGHIRSGNDCQRCGCGL